MVGALWLGVGGTAGAADAAPADDECAFPVTMTDNTGTKSPSTTSPRRW